MKIRLLIFVFIAGSFCSCQKGISDCFKGRGKPTTDNRSLESFTKIAVYDKIDLVLIKDSLAQEHAELDGFKNLLPSISLAVSNGTLTIHDNNTCEFMRDLNNRTKVKLYMKQLYSLDIHDNASVSTEKRIYLDSMEMHHFGMNDLNLDMYLKNRLTIFQENANNIKLSGRTAVFVSVLDDVSSIDASNFQGDYTFVFQNSPRDCYVWGYKELGVTIGYSGNVYYKQVPLNLDFKSTGTGKLIKQ